MDNSRKSSTEKPAGFKTELANELHNDPADTYKYNLLKENPESMVLQTYVFVSEVNEGVEEAYTTAVKGEPLIQAPAEKKIIT